MAKQELAKQDTMAGAIVAVEETSFLEELSKETNTGLDLFEHGDVAIPMLALLQKLSPQCDETHAKFIDGAKAGLAFNSVTGELYDISKTSKTHEPIFVIPVGYFKEYVEWVSRDNGGGFVARHDRNTSLVRQCENKDGKLTLPNGNSLVETSNHIVLMKEKTGVWNPIVIPMASSKQKTSRAWNKLAMDYTIVHNGKRFTPPLYSVIYEITSEQQESKKGTYFNFAVKAISTIPSTERDLYEQAKRANENFNAGLIKLAAPVDEEIPVESHDVY
jgi:hypothetical protein